MKSTILKSGLSALALLTVLNSCSKKEEGFTINGTIAGLDKGTVYLENTDEKETKKSQILHKYKKTELLLLLEKYQNLYCILLN
jgi:hypothetical protein